MKGEMKRGGVFALLLASMIALLTMCAQAEEIDITTPRKGVAVAAPEDIDNTVPMYEQASADSRVLMEYYSGARLEVIGLSADGGMARVQCGVKGASIMGYMRTGDLRYGAYAERKVPLYVMNIFLDDRTDVYSYPDPQAPVIGTKGIYYDISFEAHTRSDGQWVQLIDQNPVGFFNRFTSESKAMVHGFIHLPDGMAKGEPQARGYWFIDPAEGDLTYEQAHELAVGYAYDMQQALALHYPDGLTREQIEAMQAQVNFICLDVERGVRWEVYFDDPDDPDKSFKVTMQENGALFSVETSQG